MKDMRKRVVCEYEHYLEAKCDEVFPLLCPVREYEWIPQWTCDMVFTESGIAELGCVFATDYGDQFGRETWVVFCYTPAEKIGFVRTGKHRTTRYEIFLASLGEGTIIRWQQEITALDDLGDILVVEYDQQRFEELMVPLNQMLAHYLEKGHPLELNLDI